MSDEWQYGASASGCLANALVGGNLHAFDASFYQSKWQYGASVFLAGILARVVVGSVAVRCQHVSHRQCEL